MCELSFAPYAEGHFSQQDQESRPETVQDNRDGQSVAFAIVPPAPHVFQERQAQTAVEQNGRRRQHGRRPDQSEPALRLGVRCRSNETPAVVLLPAGPVQLCSHAPRLPTPGTDLLAECKDRGDWPACCSRIAVKPNREGRSNARYRCKQKLRLLSTDVDRNKTRLHDVDLAANFLPPSGAMD